MSKQSKSKASAPKNLKAAAKADKGFCPERAAVMAGIFDRLAPRLEYLSARWQDEREYEDIAEYAKVIGEAVAAMGLAPDFKVTGMTRRPFGFTCSLMGGAYAVKCTARELSYRRIG